MAKPTKKDLEFKKITGKEATSPDGTEHDDVVHVKRYCKCGGILDLIGHEVDVITFNKNWEQRHPDGKEFPVGSGKNHEWTTVRDEAVNATMSVRGGGDAK